MLKNSSEIDECSWCFCLSVLGITLLKEFGRILFTFIKWSVHEDRALAFTSCHGYVSTVRCMMYGFGDDQNPYTESVDILEDLVIEFITEMVSLTGILAYVHRNREARVTRLELLS